jgi:uncharacterized membrane protein YbhN (UPF0104 family)
MTEVAPPLSLPPRRRRRWIKLTIGILVVVALVVVGRNYLSDLKKIRHVSPWYAVAIGLLYLASRSVFGEILIVLLRRLGHAISRVEAFFAMSIMIYASLIFSQAGLGASAAYLNVKRKVPYSDFASVLFAMNALQLFVVGLTGLAFLALHWMNGGPGASALMLALFAVPTAGGALLAFVRFPLRQQWQGKLASFIRRMNLSLDRIGLNPTTVALCILLQVATVFVRGIRLQVCYMALGVPVHFPGVMVASLLADLTGAISITPGALGIREAAIGYAGAASGIPPETAVAAALLDRVSWTAAIIVASQIGLLHGFRRKGAAT